jgi:hypothetical protein
MIEFTLTIFTTLNTFCTSSAVVKYRYVQSAQYQYILGQILYLVYSILTTLSLFGNYLFPFIDLFLSLVTSVANYKEPAGVPCTFRETKQRSKIYFFPFDVE